MALNGMTNALAHELYPFHVALLTINPGFTATENAVRIADQFEFDISMAHSMAVPARAVGYLAACDDPMRYSGTRLSAEDLIRDLQLL
jgi:NAD(P)-dependent dehydrogenase (short-subunit alcohol dehydrogenase family)